MIKATRTGMLAAALASAFAFALQTAHAADRGERDDDDRNGEGTQLTFSTVGDSRQDDVAPDSTLLPLSGQDSIWLQSTKAWSRIMRSVQSNGSNLLVFNGDMIMGYGNTGLPSNVSTVDAILTSDLVKTYRQYAFWRGMVASLMETGTYVVPVAGNHETQYKAGGKKALAVNENAWRANMGDLILDNNRFMNLFGEQPSNEEVGDTRNLFDALPTDQSKLTYSFDFRGSHFAIVNTDPTGKDSHAPTNWLAADLYNAKARGLKHMFVFGHKPAFTYFFGTVIPVPPALPFPGKLSGLDVDAAARDAFWDVIETYHATFFCGHEHVYNVSQPRGKAYQIIVGSGGSPFDATPTAATLVATDRYYAWANVEVKKNGKVKLKAYGFDDHFGPTKALKEIELP